MTFPTSRVFHTPPRMWTVADGTHRPAQGANLFMFTGHKPLFLNHMCNNVQDTVLSLLTGRKPSTLMIQIRARARAGREVRRRNPIWSLLETARLCHVVADPRNSTALRKLYQRECNRSELDHNAFYRSNTLFGPRLIRTEVWSRDGVLLQTASSMDCVGLVS
jgi:hypothetical protein